MECLEDEVWALAFDEIDQVVELLPNRLVSSIKARMAMAKVAHFCIIEPLRKLIDDVKELLLEIRMIFFHALLFTSHTDLAYIDIKGVDIIYYCAISTKPLLNTIRFAQQAIVSIKIGNSYDHMFAFLGDLRLLNRFSFIFSSTASSHNFYQVQIFVYMKADPLIQFISSSSLFLDFISLFLHPL